MADTAEITRTDYEMYEIARNLLEKGLEYKRNHSFPSRKLFENYGFLVDNYGADKDEKASDRFQNVLNIAARDMGEDVPKVLEFLRQGYEVMVDEEMGEVINSDANDAENYLKQVTGNHQAQGFKPRETGIKNRDVGDTQIFKNFAEKAEHETRRFFSIGESIGKRKKGSTSFMARFD